MQYTAEVITISHYAGSRL